MKSVALQICYSPQPVRETVAWFVGGTRPADWLAEVLLWGVPIGELRLYAVPHSAGDRRPLGVLVTTSGTMPPAVSGRAIPFGRVAGRLYLPVVAAFDPPVTDAELTGLLGDTFEAYVWHPTAGLVGFEPGEGRKISDLLRMPPATEADWSCAHPGLPLNRRLRTVAPSEIPGAQAVIEAGRGDIGTQADELSDLPPAPGEPQQNPFRRAGSAAFEALARGIRRALDMVPRTAPAPTWLDNLTNWLDRAAQRLNLTSARERELRRLLGLLDSDPDQGLKFALPFGQGLHRGVAPPSDRLPPRDVNFDLNRLHGGGPADLWDVPFQIQQELLAKYRRLAERELALGRHRRAAYIFAELVNDLAAAAAALVGGSHFREAAVLYRDRLNQPLEAARCLERGRHWAEALEAFEKLGEFERAGDLAQKLDQPEDASRLFRAAVVAACHGSDSLTAARLLDAKLLLPDEALEELLRGWKSTGQARECIAEAFRLMGRLGHHEAAQRHLQRLSGAESARASTADVVAELASVAGTYPEPVVRASARDSVLAMTAAHLKQAVESEARALLAAVRRLAPEDRLLARDCDRFLTQRPRRASQPTLPRRLPKDVLDLCHTWQAPNVVRCVAAASAEPWFYLVGYSREGGLCLDRGCWPDSACQHAVQWPLVNETRRGPIILQPDDRYLRPVIVHLVNEPHSVLREQSFPAADLAPHPVWAGSPPWATERTLAVVDPGNGVVWELSRSQGTLVLNGYNTRRVPVASQMIELPVEALALVEDPPVQPVPLAAWGSVFYIGLGEHLVIVRRDGSTEVDPMPATIRGLFCSAPHTRRRVAVTFDGGGRVLWDEGSRHHVEWFATALAWPIAAFTPGGWLVAASSTGCEVYSTNDRRIRLEADWPWTDLSPVAILSTGTPHEFAVCFDNGRVVTYRMSRA